jgi:dTDP-4-amino-4,6-dideoxy-D-glucose acyltransferase
VQGVKRVSDNIFLGSETVVYPSAKIAGNVRVGNRCIIDDFCFLYGNIRVGDFVHIAASTSIVGDITIGNYVGISGGVRIYGASEDFSGACMQNPCVPQIFRKADRRGVIIHSHALIFANAVVLPGVTIGEGAVVGALSLVKHNVPPWVIWAGGKVIRDRPSKTILTMEKLVERYAYSWDGVYRNSEEWLKDLEDYVAKNGVVE